MFIEKEKVTEHPRYQELVKKQKELQEQLSEVEGEMTSLEFAENEPKCSICLQWAYINYFEENEKIYHNICVRFQKKHFEALTNFLAHISLGQNEISNHPSS